MSKSADHSQAVGDDAVRLGREFTQQSYLYILAIRVAVSGLGNFPDRKSAHRDLVNRTALKLVAVNVITMVTFDPCRLNAKNPKF